MSCDIPPHCPHCGSDKENFDMSYFGAENEVYEHIMCTVCGDLVASSTIPDEVSAHDIHHDEKYPTFDASDGCSMYDEDASSERNDNVVDLSDVNCEVNLIDDDHAIYTESLNHHQRLKSSYSAFNFEEKQNATVTTTLSATLDNGELSGEFLRQARQLHCQSLSCTNCTSFDSEMLPVEGMKDVFHCSCCSWVHGVDDSMNYYDLLQKGDYMVEACATCGNGDPHLFLLECGSGPDSVNLKCMKCSDMTQESQNVESIGDVETGEEDNTLEQCMKEWIHYECKCKNSNSELQKITFDFDSDTVFVKCWVCQREDMIVLSFNDLRPKTCKCTSGKSADVKYDEYGYASRLVCLQCHAEVDCGVSNAADVPAAGDGMSAGRTRISSVGDIQIGDHIADHRFLGYWHHAIVTDVNGRQIRVVHYNGPGAHKGEVVEEWMPVDVSSELYRIDYKPFECNHPKVVVDRARSRLNECNYNILTNNCEHFARWCKTGHKRSMQSESFIQSMTRRVVTLLESSVVSGAKWFFSTPEGHAALKHGANIVTNTGTGAALKAAAEQAVSKEVTPLLAAGKFAIPALIIRREIQMVCRDIRDANHQRRAGEISREEFIKVTIKRTAEGCGSLAGVGVAVAIPFARNSIGCTLASVIGQAAGVVVGRSICSWYGRKSTD